MSVWRDVARIHRLEYPFPIHYLCHATLGAAYAVSDVQQLFNTTVLLAILANLLAIVGGNPLNAAVDISTNAKTKGKGDIANAALRLGRRRAISWAAIDLAFALALATVIALWLGRALIAVSVGLVIALCLLYNLEPARLKRRGFTNPITIGLTLGPLPSLASYNAVRHDLAASVWPIFVGIGALITGRALWWTVPDQIGDRATGMKTPALQYGAFRAIALACVVTVIGLGLLGWGLWWRYGLLPALLAAAVSAAFLLSQLVLLHRVSDHTLPNSIHMRRRSLFSVTVADVFLVLIPLAATA